jgi:hypothetical protein
LLATIVFVLVAIITVVIMRKFFWIKLYHYCAVLYLG